MYNPITPSRAKFLHAIVDKAPPGDIVECGVYMGWSAAILIAAAKGTRRIILCDSFAGFPSAAGESYDVQKIVAMSKAETMDENTTISFLRSVHLSISRVQFVKGFFANTLPELARKDLKIAVLHFDGDLYSSAIDVFKNLWPSVVPGGYLVIHDYPAFAGCKKAVEEFFDVSKIVIEGPEEVYIRKD